MGRDGWFRNTSWDEDIETAFFKKLSRARDKAQYLRIQASCLASIQPKVALRLLDRYFALGEHFDHAQAHVERANAYAALGDIDAAIISYDSALTREKAYPSLLTSAYLDLPSLIVAKQRREIYDRAIHVLTENKGRPAFPFERYRWHGLLAILLKIAARCLRHARLLTLRLKPQVRRTRGFVIIPRSDWSRTPATRLGAQ
jgi:tetratricopeptide (TPR) repeat protein